ncbi:MAG: hypothetical protein JW812_00950 [Alphaproteobacteria bacterium]|nr:hypothetical protein [Alphaproteobacteria bacterium]
MIEIKEVEAKSILVKSNLPDSDYVINPYTGCEFGCHYCYASFMCRYIDKDISEWGNFVHVKINAIELLDKKLCTFKTPNATIFSARSQIPIKALKPNINLPEIYYKCSLHMIIPAEYPS